MSTEMDAETFDLWVAHEVLSEVDSEVVETGRWTVTYRRIYQIEDGSYVAVEVEEVVGENSGGWEQESYTLVPVTRVETTTYTYEPIEEEPNA